MSILKIALGAMLTLYVLLVLALYFFQESFIFLGEPLPADYQYSFSSPFEEIDYTMTDGAIINALHFRSDQSKGIIYYHHGNAGNLARWGGIVQYFVQFGYDVLVYDYRGYGKSTGHRSEALMHQDAQFIYDQLKTSWNEDQILVYGRSLGSGLACQLASNNTPGKLILETPFYSLKSIAQWRFPFLPTSLLVSYNMLNWKNLQQTTSPIYIFHGTDDGVVPYWSGEKLYESVPKGQAAFTTIEGAQHNNLIDFEAYRQEIEQILTQ